MVLLAAALAQLQVASALPGHPPFSLQDHLYTYGANLPWLTGQYLAHDGHENPDDKTRSQYYFRLYRRLKKLAEADRPIIELRKENGLVTAYPTTALYLVRQEQNSKTQESPAKATNRAQSEEILQRHHKDQIPPLYRLPARSKPQRIEAIKTYLSIRNPAIFQRPDPGTLHPELSRKLNQTERLFQSYLTEIDDQVIVLKKKSDGHPGPEYCRFPYTVRFNDQSKKLRNLETYEKGIENSLVGFTDGVFLTLTTDPLLWMGQQGMEFTRQIRNKDGEILATYHARAKGKTLWHANRHESEAWRRYYEKLVHRFGWRIPYIRVVEFMENGLIHLHVLFFGIKWLDDFRRVAYDWGVTYGQGFNCQVCRVRKKNGIWQWATRNDAPQDADGKQPADYLKKYLKKALWNEEGYAGYWIANKRFFTMSQSLRYQEIAEAARAKAERQGIRAYEFFGTIRADLVPEAIARASRSQRIGPPDPIPVDRIPLTWMSDIPKDRLPFARRRAEDLPDPPPRTAAVKLETGGELGNFSDYMEL